jgi:flagellar biosynthesis protein FlhG
VRLIEETPVAATERETPEILVVGGGKGGVGKTCLSANLAVYIAKRGWRVVLVDADLSCSNVETVLGIHSDLKLDEFFLQKGGKDLQKLLIRTPYDNLRLIPGTSGLIDVANPRYQQKVALIRELRQLEADLIIVDLDAGAHLNTLDFFLMTKTNGIMVITPEKTSIDNAYKFLRAALFRRFERFYQCPELGIFLKRMESVRQFIDCLKHSDMFDQVTRNRICGEVLSIARSVQPKIVVNRASNAYQAQIAANIVSKFTRNALCINPEMLGHVFFDKCVSDTVNCGTPFVVSYPRHRISACVRDIANRLGYF